jgi:hypothetical protein
VVCNDVIEDIFGVDGLVSANDTPAGTLRIHNVAVWLLFGQVPFLRENYVATTYFRYVMCKSYNVF